MAKDITLESSLEFISKQSLKDLQKYKAQLERRLAVVTATINDVMENGKNASSGDETDAVVGNGKKKRAKAGRGTVVGSRAKKPKGKRSKSSTITKPEPAPSAEAQVS